MTSDWNLFSYLMAIIAAAGVLAWFRASAWYMHVTGAAVGFVAGLMPPLGASGEVFYLITGTTFFFFTTWGLAGLLVPRAQSRRAPGAGERSVRASRLRRSPGTETILWPKAPKSTQL